MEGGWRGGWRGGIGRGGGNGKKKGRRTLQDRPQQGDELLVKWLLFSLRASQIPLFLGGGGAPVSK